VTDPSRSPEYAAGEHGTIAHLPLDFRSIFENEFDYVWNTLRRLGVREADLKDQTQEVFLIVHQLLDDYDRTRPMRPWLFGIAYRYAARYRALARNRREVWIDPSETPVEQALADDQVAAAEDRALVLRAIEQIEFTRRAVFVMAEIDGCTVPEIADALAIPLNTAYSRLRLARRDFTVAVTRLRAAGDVR
jgi:RNA polymerase sigma-70 factor (ECF subfamily)